MARRRRATKRAVKLTEGAKQVLALLRRARGKWVAGSAIAEKLKVSRQRIHQHVARLREAGYPIEGQPRFGYRLGGGKGAPRKGKRGGKKA